MKRVFTIILVLVLIFVVASCGGKKKTEDKLLPEEEVTKEISAEEGGKIENSDKSVSIEVPEGALESNTKITMRIYNAKDYPGTEDKTVISKVVEFEPSGIIFKKPVFISMTSNGGENNLLRTVQSTVVTAAVYREEKDDWSFSPIGAAVKISGQNESGDPIMTSANGDPIMLDANGDPIMKTDSGNKMLSASGDPIMITASGNPVKAIAAGDPIMMTTGHFTAYAFFLIKDENEESSEPDDDKTTDEDDNDKTTETDDDIEMPDDEDSDIPISDEDPVVPEPEPELLRSKVLCTGMTICTDENGSQILCPEEGKAFYGQDAQYAVRGSCIPNHGLKEVMKPEMLENDFVEVHDENTGLTWLYIGTRGDYEYVHDGCDISYGGKEDWRFPTPKELMTLAWNDRLFNGNPATDIVSFFQIIREGYSSNYSDKYGIYLWSSIENYIYALEYGMTIPPKAYESYQSVFDYGFLVCVSGEEYGKVNADNYASITRSGGEMVFDSSTNLYWQKDSGKAETWKEALNYCENLEYAGFSDWRLPNKNELVTLIDHSKPGSDVVSSFPGMKADVFWSSTSAGEYKWVVDMTDGTAYTFNGKTAGGFYIMRHSELPISVRCVRSKLDKKTEIPACNESGVAPCKTADGTIWSSVIYPEIFADFNKSYISSQNFCRDRSCTEDVVYLRNVAEMCRSLKEKGSHKWRLPTIDEIRSILMSEKLNKDGSCGVTDKCFDVSCYSEESCLDDKPSQTLFYDFGGMISATPVKSDGDEDEDKDEDEEDDYDYDGKIWTVDMWYGALHPSDLYSEIPLYMLVQRCVLDKDLPYEKAPYTDPETGITWSDISSDYLPIQEAEDYCYDLSKGDPEHWWRIPTLDELKTVVRNCSEEEDSCPVDVTGKYSLFGEFGYLWAADSDGELHYVDFSEVWIYGADNTDWSKVRCVSDGSNPCADDPCSGLARCNVVEKGGKRTYECGCPDFYKWNGSMCVSICSTDPCGSVLHSTGLCTPTSDTTYKCGCASGYWWNGSACVNPCADDPNSTGELTVVSAEDYECSCNEDGGFFWSAAEHKCVIDPCHTNPEVCVY